MSAVVPRTQITQSQRISARLAKLEEIEILVQVGEYRQGSDPLADEALASRPAMDAFLRQDTDDHSSFQTTLAQLANVGGGT